MMKDDKVDFDIHIDNCEFICKDLLVLDYKFIPNSDAVCAEDIELEFENIKG